jgi:hypothetical protein
MSADYAHSSSLRGCCEHPSKAEPLLHEHQVPQRGMEGKTPQKAERTAGKQFCCWVIGGTSLLRFDHASRVAVGDIKHTYGATSQ